MSVLPLLRSGFSFNEDYTPSKIEETHSQNGSVSNGIWSYHTVTLCWWKPWRGALFSPSQRGIVRVHDFIAVLPRTTNPGHCEQKYHIFMKPCNVVLKEYPIPCQNLGGIPSPSPCLLVHAAQK